MNAAKVVYPRKEAGWGGGGGGGEVLAYMGYIGLCRGIVYMYDP